MSTIKRKQWILIPLIVATCLCNSLYAQSDALFSVESTSQGILIPSMTQDQKDAIATPSEGLLIYQTTDPNGFYFYDGSSWIMLSDASANSVTQLTDADDDTKIQAEKTPDEDIIRFDIAGTEKWRMTGSRLEPDNNGNSLFIGKDAGINDDMSFNLNTFIGNYAGFSNTTGNKNTVTGFRAFQKNTTGNLNAVTGYYALHANTLGAQNSAFGSNALLNNTTGSNNTSLGFSSLSSNTGGFGNTATGREALTSNTTGNNNTAIGFKADVQSGSLSNATAIGYNAKVGSSNSLVLGGTGGSAVNVGIGTANPSEKLHVMGNIKMRDGNEASGKVLTSDVNGVGSWQALPTDPDEDATNEIQDLASVLAEGNNAAASKITNLMDPSANQDAATKKYVDDLDTAEATARMAGDDNLQMQINADTDGDETNEYNTSVALSGTMLQVTDGGGTKSTDLFSLMDGTGTDDQILGLSMNSLSIEDGNAVDLSSYLDNTDEQDLSLSGNTLSLSNDASSVNLSAYLDNTDDQVLTIDGNSLVLTSDNGTDMVDLSTYLDNTDNQTLTDVLGEGNSAGSTKITNLLDPTADQDAATKKYVDDSDDGGTLQGTDGNQYNIRARNEGNNNGNARGESSVDLQTQKLNPSHIASGTGSVISGGYYNTSSAFGSVISGGSNNIASNNWAVVSGGSTNMATAESSIVAGGNHNEATALRAVISGGEYNTASAYASIVSGGAFNSASGDNSSIGGGSSNQASGSNTAIGGGASNQALTSYSNIGGGRNNQASGVYSTIPGGLNNLADSYGETVVGIYNEASGGTSASIVATDPIFVVGNGTSDASRSNAMLIQKNGNVGIGSNSPDEALHVEGNIKMVDGNEADGKVLTSDADGVGSWENLPAEGGTLQGTDTNIFNIRARDEGTVAGDARAEYTVDLQTMRENATEVASGVYSSVLGGFSNTASGDTSVVAGGSRNTASGARSSIGGGVLNVASFRDATVAGGEENTASGSNAAIGGGENNIASGVNSTIAGGDSNEASDLGATISGGTDHVASGEDSSIGGGYENTASSDGTTIAGGVFNRTNEVLASVGGGIDNTASGEVSVVAGGAENTASGDESTVSGGLDNESSGNGASIGGGSNNTALGIQSVIGGGNNNAAVAPSATIGGGAQNLIIEENSTIGGGKENTILMYNTTIGGGYSNTALESGNTIGGGTMNATSGEDATIGGGYTNTAQAPGSTVGGGALNVAGNIGSTVSGGISNQADGDASTVGGGNDNTASGEQSTVGGGSDNTASGRYASIPGGASLIADSYGETVVGIFNEASGGTANTITAGDPVFVVGNGTGTGARSNAMVIEKEGDVGIGTNDPDEALHVVGNIKMVDGNEAIGKVLISDADGVGSWQEAAGNRSLFVLKTTDQTATDDATLTDDTDFVFVLEASTTYKIEASIEFLETNDANARVAFSYSGVYANISYSFPGVEVLNGHTNDLNTSEEIPITSSEKTEMLLGYLTTDTAGTLTFQYRPADDMGDTATLTLNGDSFMILTKLD